MARIRLKYVDSYVDCTGKQRHYFRRGRHALRIALPGRPGSPEFMEAYQAALVGEMSTPKRWRGEPGTFDRLVQEYLESTNFAQLSKSSQRPYKLVIERWVREEGIGHRLVRQMTRQHVDKMLAKRHATPGAANDLLKKIRILIGFARANRWRHDDPTAGIKRYKAGTFHTWTDNEIEAFEARWPVGTPERLAFGLLLFTGQRRSDVVRMSWHDIEHGMIRVVQQKTKTKLSVPIHPDLEDMLAATPKSHVMILVTQKSKPFSAAGFGNWMADKIAAVGLPDACVTHGLRKAAARRLAEAGCSTLQIMAVTGHKSLTEVENYTREAQQKSSARAAIGKLKRRIANTDSLKREGN
jgi:integrase